MSNVEEAHTGQQSADKLSEENKILKIAVAHMELSVFVFDRSTMIMRFIDDNPRPLHLPSVIDDPLVYMVEQKIVASENVEAFNEMIARSRAGAETSCATIKAGVAGRDHGKHWYSVILTNCFDENGAIIRVVGTIHNVTDRIVSELKYSKEEQFRLAMLAENRRVYELDITRDRFMPLESLNDDIDSGQWQPYVETMLNICKTRVYKDDRAAFLKIADRDSLLESFSRGQHEFYCEYRTVDDNGDLLWSGSTTHLLSDPMTGDIKGFIYAQDIDVQKRQELLLRYQAERDPLTCVYNRTASEYKIEEILSASTRKQLHGFLSIDIDDFKTVNDTFGHVQGDILLKNMADGFSAMLRNDDIFARMGGDEFIVFLPNVGSVNRIHSIANRLCEFVHTLHLNGIDDIHFSISVGIAIYPDNGDSFGELYKYSDAALYYAKQRGKNQISDKF